MQMHSRPRAIDSLCIHPEDGGDESEGQEKDCNHGESHN